MSSKANGSARRCQGNSLAPVPVDRDKPLVPSSDREDQELALYRQDLKDAIEESREKKEFVAAAMGLPGPEYLSKLFSGEKPISARHITGLPDNVEKIFERLRAERRGVFVVDPITDPVEAARAIAASVIGMGIAVTSAIGTASALPAPNGQTVKAEIRSPKRTAVGE